LSGRAVKAAPAPAFDQTRDLAVEAIAVIIVFVVVFAALNLIEFGRVD
jgi:hypothetical protein